MNERIKELAVEAKLIASEPNGFDPASLTKAQRKFAELIVRECASRVDHILRERQAGGGNMGDDIREHFGVKQ